MVGSTGRTLSLPINSQQKVEEIGLINITAEEKHPSKGETAYIKLVGDINDTSYIFFIIYKEIEKS